MNKPRWMPMASWNNFVSKFTDLDDNLIHCVSCGDSDPAHMSVDHITPRVKGGGNELSNLQPMCRSCNSSKNARPDKYWSSMGYFDEDLDIGRLRVSQNDFVYQPIFEENEFFARPWPSINGKLFSFFQVVGAGKTLGMFALPFALNASVKMHHEAAPRVDRMLIITKDQALRSQIANELRTEPVQYGLVQRAPEVLEIENGSQLIDANRDHDIAVMCPNMLWPERDAIDADAVGNVDGTTIQWHPHMDNILNAYPLVCFDEMHYAYYNIALLVKAARQNLVFGFTASPIEAAGSLLEDMVRVSVYGYGAANHYDNSMKYLSTGAQ